MKILICTKQDLPSVVALNSLVPNLASDQLSVVLTDRTRSAEWEIPQLGMLKLLERDLPFQTLFPALNGHAAMGEARLLTFDELGRRHGVPFTTVEHINRGDGLALARALAPDLVISIRFSLIFREPMLALPRLGIVNLHPGPLPGYGGLFAVMRQLLDGQNRLGVTLHWVDRGIDTGPVIDTCHLPVEPGRSMLWHVLRIYRIGVDVIVRTVAALKAGRTVPAVPQQPAAMRYFGMPDSATLARFTAAGHRLFDLDEYRRDLETFFHLPPELAALIPRHFDGRTMGGAGKSLACGQS